MDAESAAGRVGLDPFQGYELLRKRTVVAAIQVESANRSNRTQIFGDEILQRWWMIARADPREVVEVQRRCCRHCHGIDHEHQMTDVEHRHAMRDHELKMQKLRDDDRYPFDDRGGPGFDRTRDPNPACTECRGDGVEHVHIHDSRDYSPGAALLYQGIEVGGDGSIKVKMRDQNAALDRVAHHLGLRAPRSPRQGIMDPAQLSIEEIDELIERVALLTGTSADVAEDDPPAGEDATDVTAGPADDLGA